MINDFLPTRICQYFSVVLEVLRVPTALYICPLIPRYIVMATIIESIPFSFSIFAKLSLAKLTV